VLTPYGERICHEGKPFNYKDERGAGLFCSLIRLFCALSYRVDLRIEARGSSRLARRRIFTLIAGIDVTEAEQI
jgi:hypothetical protein